MLRRLTRHAPPALALALLLPLLPPGTVEAGGPVSVGAAGEEALGKGTLEALALGSDGVLRLGASFEAVPLGAPTAWCALRAGEALWVGCGNDASLRRVLPGQPPQSVMLGDGLMVTALAPLADGAVAAAVFPGGRLLKVDAAGSKAEALALLPAEHVWALLSDGRGGLLAATGVPGAIFAVDAFGAVSKVCDVDDDHARCLAGSADDLLVGTAGKGRVLRRMAGKLSVLRDLEQDEVVGLVRLADGSLLVAANTDAGGGSAQQLAVLLKQLAQPAPTRGEQKPQERAALQDGAVLHLEASGAVTPLWQGKKTALLALNADGEGAMAGVYPSGRVLSVAPGRSASVFADLPEAEASVLVSDAKGLTDVVTSNPATLHRRRAGAAQGTYTSAPLDAGAVARWGRLTLAGRGVKGADWRVGETSEPDPTWGPWTPTGGFDGLSGATGSTARFLQVRLTLAGADAELRSLAVTAEAPNRAPVLSGFTFGKPKKEEAGPSPLREIGWKAEDADQDALLTTVEVQREGSSRWTALAKEQALEKPLQAWDTTGLPDGLYRVRISVSDAPANPVDRLRTAVLLSPPQRVDNSAPRVTLSARLVGERLLVEGEAQDQPGGAVAGVRVAVDGGPWQALPAKDGLFDSPAEAFSASLASPGPGEHDVVVQALDADKNPGASAVVVSVPAAR